MLCKYGWVISSRFQKIILTFRKLSKFELDYSKTEAYFPSKNGAKVLKRYFWSSFPWCLYWQFRKKTSIICEHRYNFRLRKRYQTGQWRAGRYSTASFRSSTRTQTKTIFFSLQTKIVNRLIPIFQPSIPKFNGY